MDGRTLAIFGLSAMGVLYLLGNAFMVLRLFTLDASEHFMECKMVYDIIVLGLFLLYELVIMIMTLL